MPRKVRVRSDFRTPEQRREDDAATEVRWRCPVHGVQPDAIILDRFAYCPVDPCTSAMVPAWGRKRMSAQEWNASSLPPREDS